MLRAKFGRLFDHPFLLANIESASCGPWPFIHGVGWRSNLAGRIGLIGSLKNVTDIRFRTRR